MAQRNWVTELADQFEGGISTEKAMLDIERGVIENLFHECWGLYGSASPKNVSGVSFIKTGIVAFDRVKFLFWKDYSAIAKGEDVIVSHIGNVDTVQWPIKRKWYNSTELPKTDLARLKNDPLYRANMVASITRTLAASFDGELFDLLISTAMAQKGAVIEMEIPKHFNPNKIDMYMEFADLVAELEMKISAYYQGVPRKEIQMLVYPTLYTKIIRALTGGQMLMEKTFSFIQHEQIKPAVVTGINIVRHIGFNNIIHNEATNEFRTYNFKGIRAIIYHVATPWLVQSFNSTTGVINKDTGELPHDSKSALRQSTSLSWLD